jgi:hypothetical protein
MMTRIDKIKQHVWNIKDVGMNTDNEAMIFSITIPNELRKIIELISIENASQRFKKEIQFEKITFIGGAKVYCDKAYDSDDMSFKNIELQKCKELISRLPAHIEFYWNQLGENRVLTEDEF